MSGITVGSGSNATFLGTLTGTTNGGVGLQVSGGSNVRFSNGSASVTGTGGDVKVGSQATTAWTNVTTGQLQYINDFSFPALAAPTLTSVVEMCTCSPM